MRGFLIALSGARPEVLERCKTEYGKFEGIGGAVLTTAVLAVVSMTFALHSALGLNVILAVLASLVWGLAILSLDRWLVSTIRADAPRRWALALPRIVMAILLGFVISTPLVLQIFSAEINAQIVHIKQKKADEFVAQQKQGDVGKDVDQLRKRVTDLQKVIASGGDQPIDPEQDPKIVALTAERKTERTQADKHYKEWQCQLYGGKSCSGVPKGNGPLAQASKRAYDQDKRRITLINGQIEDRKQELSATSEDAKQTRLVSAQEALPKAQRALDAGLARQGTLQQSFDEENENSSGLLLRLQALNEVTGQDMTLSAARVLLFLVFLLIECLPVTVKLMQRPGNYEKVLALAEQHEFRDARGSFAPKGMTRPSSSAGGAGEGQGSWNVWRTWTARDSGPERVPADGFHNGSYRGPSGTRAESPPDNTFEYGSPEDEALRRMQDTRTMRMSGAERPGGVELLPDDE